MKQYTVTIGHLPFYLTIVRLSLCLRLLDAVCSRKLFADQMLFYAQKDRRSSAAPDAYLLLQGRRLPADMTAAAAVRL